VSLMSMADPRVSSASRRASVLLAVLLAGLLAGAPAAAEHNCTVAEAPLPGGGYRLVRECPPHEGRAGGGGGGGVPSATGAAAGGGSGVTCQRSQVEPGAGHLVDEQGRVVRPVNYVCTDGNSWQRWECIPAYNPDPPGPPCSDNAQAPPDAERDVAEIFDGLLQQAAAQIDPPLPRLRHTFDQPADDGTVRAIVLAETWWWTEESLEPIVADASDGDVSVRVTATPGALEIDPGDGRGTFTCTSMLTYDRTASYYDQVPGEPKGACVHVYQQVFDEVTATISVTWGITYQGFAPELGGLSGSLGTQTRQQITSFPVQEIQSVIVR
jgi:hypothetical protein